VIGDLDASLPPAGGEPDLAGPVRGSFVDFYRHAYPALVGFVVLQAGTWTEAEDIAQEAFAVAHRRWATVGSYDNPAAWVRLVALNRARSRRRKARNDLVALTRLVRRSVRHGNEHPWPEPPDPKLCRGSRKM
jgi:RNA polymerase sigma-70 factor (ECF subfamily)